jgi:outer membrane lipoprotein LolB
MRLFGQSLLLLCAGCSSMPGVDLTVVDEGFALTGRFAIRHAQEGGSGRIEWRHTANTDDLLVSSPIGQGLARVTRRDGVYEITTREQQVRRAVDAQALTEKMLGWRLPLEGLPDWVRGRPSPDLPARVERDVQGRVAWIEQQGWRIEYQQYRDALPADAVQNFSAAPAPLPLRIQLQRDDLQIRLLIEQWSVRDASGGATGSAP